MKNFVYILIFVLQWLLSYVSNADSEMVGGVEWTYDITDSGLRITGAETAEGDLFIPSKINGLAVTSIGSSAFWANGYWGGGITSVTIPDSVEDIGAYAFGWCRGLTNVVIGAGTKEFANDRFYSCDNVLSIVISEQNLNIKCIDGMVLTKDGTRICAAPSARGYVSIPDTVKTIGEDAFLHNHNITSVSIPPSVIDVENSAFNGCSDLKTIKLSEGIQSIGEGAFCDCESLKGVLLPTSVRQLGMWVFQGCIGLSMVVVPDQVQSMPHGLFQDCSGLEVAYIPIRLKGTFTEDSIFIWGNEFYKVTASAVYYKSAPSCLLAGISEDDKIIPAMGHAEVETLAAQEPTCTEDGLTREGKCSRCGEVLEASTVPKLGHVAVETKAAQEPTCTEVGWTHEMKCSRCGEVLEESEAIPNLGGHTGAITKPAVEPASAAAGVTAEITCTRCGEVLQEQTTIPALGYIRNVTAKQRYPWNGKVDITYTLAEDTPELWPDSLTVTVKDKESGATYTAAASALSGDTGTEAGTHHVVWNLNVQGLEIKSDDVVFTVAYWDAPPLYCVIDLSGGANATSYPITYLDDVPSGGWTDEYKTTKLVLRRIEPGQFVMGGQGNVSARKTITLTKSYYVGVFEITQKQYELVMASNPSDDNGDLKPVDSVSYNMIRGTIEGAKWPASSSVDASSFIGKLRDKTGLSGLDLPTEAQWEYACRAGTTTVYSYGDNENGDYMWYKSNSSYSTHDVGTREPNQWGLYDMHGNVWEWCLDWWEEWTQDRLEQTDPQGPEVGAGRCYKGGGCKNSSSWTCSATRTYIDPSRPSGGGEGDVFGFRIINNMVGGSGGGGRLIRCFAQPIARPYQLILALALPTAAPMLCLMTPRGLAEMQVRR